MVVLKKKRKDTKYSDHRKINLTARTPKMVARILRGTERKVEDVFGESQFGFSGGKGTGGAVGMLRVISERALDIDEELRACFLDRQKVFDRAKWTKFMQILKGNGIDWGERRLISKLYVDQTVKIKLD